MELRRLFRILGARWALVALVAFVGFASAFGLTALASEGVTPVYEAVIPIEFELEGEETVDDLAQEIQSERGLAVLAAQDLIAAHPGAQIVANTNLLQLSFYGRGSSGEEAASTAQALVDAYLEADPSGGGDIGELMDELERQAEELQLQIDALQPSLSVEEQALKSQHQLLDLQITRIQEEIVALTVANAGASSAERADNEERIADLEEELLELQAEKAALPPPPSEALTPSEQLRLDALIRRKDILTVDYQRLALRTMGVTGGGNVQPVKVEDLTPDPPNPLVNGALGLLGGVGVALVAMVLTSRARKEVWLPDDLPIPLLGVVPDRRADNTLTDQLWYDQAQGGRRKESIQAVRTAIEGVLVDGPAAVALVSDGLDPRLYQDLAIDVAASFASAGRKVLLIDADYTNAGAGAHLKGEPSLRTLLDPPNDADGQYESVGAALDDLTHLRADLSVLPAGAVPASPADSLAGQPLRVLLDEARGRFDMVILAAGPAGSATAQVIASRIGIALVAIAPGRSTVSGVERLVVDFAYQRVEPIGAIMVQRSSRLRSRLPSIKVRPARVTTDSRSHERPLQPIGRKAQGGLALRRMVEDLSDRETPREGLPSVESAEGARELGDELTGALRSAHPGHAYESLATYLVTRVEDMLTSVGSRVGMADRLGDVLLRYGFIPLTRVPGHRSMGEWLVEDLRWELGANVARDLEEEFTRLLDTSDDFYPSPLDAWLADEFFHRHLQRTHMEPEVWHLASERGTIQVLAYGRALDRERLNRLETDVVLRTSTLLEQRIAQASKSQGDKLKEELKDAQLFRVSLELLQRAVGGDAEGSHHWRRRESRKPAAGAPWIDGVNPNIALFQRFGLLVVPVLTDEEMVALEQAG